ncbi:MAG TPA: hypothetical protein VJ992_11495 [Gemmatimonadales bacterium]|nr:hypothetical protein [Gemmatimonadales bacterium]
MNSLFTYAEAIILFVAMVIAAYAAALAAARDGTPWRGILRGGAVSLWFVVLYEAARIGAFNGRIAMGVWPLVAAMAIPPALLAARYTRDDQTRASTSAASLAAIQIYRLLGGGLILLAVGGAAIPAWIGLPGGLLEILTGAGGAVVGAMLQRGGARARRVGWVWGAFAIGSGLFLLTMTAAMARGPTYFLTLYPLVLLPAFIVPMSVAFDLALLAKVRAMGEEAA